MRQSTERSTLGPTLFYTPSTNLCEYSRNYLIIKEKEIVSFQKKN